VKSQEPIMFITSNEHKFKEAESVLKDCGITISHKRLRYDEARKDSCAEVAAISAEECYRRFKKPLFVEDSGLFISELNGFPGTYSAWVFSCIGNGGVLRILRGSRRREARFVSAVAYVDKSGVHVFEGEVQGRLADRVRGAKGFGYDPIFIPEGWGETYGESDEAKKETSHRMRSLLKFAQWFKRKGTKR